MEINVHGENDILLVDDDQVFHFIFKRFYEKNNDIANQLVSVYSGEQCLSYLEARKDSASEHPSLILMDINMPGMLGYECVEKIRKIPVFKSIPNIIMFSSSNFEGDIEKSLKSGANSYSEKPDNLQELRFVCSSSDPGDS